MATHICLRCNFDDAIFYYLDRLFFWTAFITIFDIYTYVPANRILASIDPVVLLVAEVAPQLRRHIHRRRPRVSLGFWPLDLGLFLQAFAIFVLQRQLYSTWLTRTSSRNQNWTWLLNVITTNARRKSLCGRGSYIPRGHSPRIHVISNRDQRTASSPTTPGIHSLYAWGARRPEHLRHVEIGEYSWQPVECGGFYARKPHRKLGRRNSSHQCDI